jgi:hypothetical protein
MHSILAGMGVSPSSDFRLHSLDEKTAGVERWQFAIARSLCFQLDSHET